MPTVGVVSLGAMGSAVADALARGGVRVVATLTGPSGRTTGLAERARVELPPDLAAVADQADVVLSIVPPEQARTAADTVLRTANEIGRTPLFVELNAIAPATALEIASTLEMVDGAISGPPPWKPGTTRVYLSGLRAGEIAKLPFDGVDLIVVGAAVGAASAVKMSTASVYKGSAALLRAGAAGGACERRPRARAGRPPHRRHPELVANVERRLGERGLRSPGRYVGEMHEIAATQSAAGLTPALFEALAEVYAALAETPAARRAPEEIPEVESLEQLLRNLREA